MKNSLKLSRAIHILVFMDSIGGDRLTSDEIAKSIRTNPGCVRQLMSSLREAGIINSTQGHPKPEIAKELKDITMLDIYNAVESDRRLCNLTQR